MQVRQMLLVGEDPKKYINEYSNQFKKDFLQQLRTSHGEKSVHINHFYQDYIHNKEHIHMNGECWRLPFPHSYPIQESRLMSSQYV